MALSTEFIGGRILLRFPFNAELKDELKATIRSPDCHWDGENRAWSIRDGTEVRQVAASIFVKHGLDASSLEISAEDEAEKGSTTDGIVANWFRIMDDASGFHSYWVNVPNGEDAWSNRRRIVTGFQREHPDNRFAMLGQKMLCIHQLSDSNLTESCLRYAGRDSSDRAHETMLLEVLKREAGDEEYDNMFGRLISKNPIASEGGYELYQKHEMKVRSFRGIRVLQADNSTIRSLLIPFSPSGKMVNPFQRGRDSSTFMMEVSANSMVIRKVCPLKQSWTA